MPPPIAVHAPTVQAPVGQLVLRSPSTQFGFVVQLDLPPQEAHHVCLKAILQANYLVKEDHGHLIKIKENKPLTRISISLAVHLEVELEQHGQNLCFAILGPGPNWLGKQPNQHFGDKDIHVNMLGFSINWDRYKDHLGQLRAMISSCSQDQKQQMQLPTQPDLSAQLDRLVDLLKLGHITQQEFAAAKAKLLLP